MHTSCIFQPYKMNTGKAVSINNLPSGQPTHLLSNISNNTYPLQWLSTSLPLHRTHKLAKDSRKRQRCNPGPSPLLQIEVPTRDKPNQVLLARHRGVTLMTWLEWGLGWMMIMMMMMPQGCRKGVPMELGCSRV